MITLRRPYLVRLCRSYREYRRSGIRRSMALRYAHQVQASGPVTAG